MTDPFEASDSETAARYEALLSRYWPALAAIAGGEVVPPRPSSDAELSAAEDALGFALPADLRILYSIHSTVPGPTGIFQPLSSLVRRHVESGRSVIGDMIEVTNSVQGRTSEADSLDSGSVPMGPYLYLGANEAYAFYLEWAGGMAWIGGMTDEYPMFRILSSSIEAVLEGWTQAAEAGLLRVGTTEGTLWVRADYSDDATERGAQLDLPCSSDLIWLD